MSFKLYDLTASYQNVLDLITDSEEENIGIVDTLEAIDDAIDDKLNATAIIYKTVIAEADAVKNEINRLKKRESALKNNAERIKEFAKHAMEVTGKTKVKGQTFTLRIQNSPPSAVVTNDKAIPGHYLIEQEPAVDKRALLEDLKNGIAVEGAELKESQHLRIV